MGEYYAHAIIFAIGTGMNAAGALSSYRHGDLISLATSLTGWAIMAVTPVWAAMDLARKVM